MEYFEHQGISSIITLIKKFNIEYSEDSDKVRAADLREVIKILVVSNFTKLFFKAYSKLQKSVEEKEQGQQENKYTKILLFQFIIKS